MPQHCCIRTLRAHLDLSPCAKRHVPAKKCCFLTLKPQLDLSPCARRPVHATTLLRSHAVSTLGSHSVRRETCSFEKTAAFCREHTWISLRAQKDMFHRKDCCDLAAPPQIDELYLRTPDLPSSAHTPLMLSGTRDPKPQSPRLCFTDCRPHKRIRCWGITPESYTYACPSTRTHEHARTSAYMASSN